MTGIAESALAALLITNLAQQAFRYQAGQALAEHLAGHATACAASTTCSAAPPELADCSCDQISIETAQSGLDCSVLAALDGKTIILGVLDLNDLTVESPETVLARVRRALPYVPPDRLVLAPDCGMKYLPRDVAFGKLTALTAAAARLRAEFTS